MKYYETDLIFFIIVDHKSDDTCIPPYEAYKHFDEFGFTYLGHRNLGTFTDWGKFNKVLSKVYEQVSEAFIEDDTEGSVLYFIHKTKKGDRVLSLSKLKTLEYRIYRKLREKLKNYISGLKQHKYNYSRLMSMMKTQTKQLCRNF